MTFPEDEQKSSLDPAVTIEISLTYDLLPLSFTRCRFHFPFLLRYLCLPLYVLR